MEVVEKIEKVYLRMETFMSVDILHRNYPSPSHTPLLLMQKQETTWRSEMHYQQVYLSGK